MLATILNNGRISAANGVITTGVLGASGVSFQVSGSFVGTLTFQGSVNGTDFLSLPVTPIAGGSTVTTTTTTGIWIGNVSGFQYVQIQMTSYSSGTAEVTVGGVEASPAVTASSSVTGGTSSSFGSTFPATGTAAGFEDASGNMAPVVLEVDGSLPVTVVGGGGGGGAVTIADGADVTEGAIADSAVTGDNTGTVSAKLRGLDKILADVWDSVNHWLKVSIQNATLAVTQSGSWTVTATQSTFASLKATITGNGTAGTADAGVVTVQGIASMTPVQVSQATASSLNATVVGTGTFATQSAITAASGAVASGAFASGALASGSIAAGAIAAGATSIADNEDVASADGDRGVKVLVTRKATPANTSGTDGDYEFLQVSAGRLWTQGTNVRIYGSPVTLTTTNFVSLANGSGWQSASITTNGNDVQFLLTTKSAGTAYVDLYLAEELSGGSTWTDGATGSEGTFTAANRLNSRYLGSIRLNNASTSAAFKASDIYSVIPGVVSLIAINNSGASISATGGDTVFTYQVVA